MITKKLRAEMRMDTIDKNPKKLRSRGFIPGVLYGRNKDTRELQLKTKELQKLLAIQGYGAMVSLELDNEIIPAIIKEVQKGVIDSEILNIDFQQLSENEKIKISIPILLENKEKIEDAVTIIQQQLMELDIQCLPKYIPNNISLDVVSMQKGHALTVGDMDILKNENIEVLNDIVEVVASITSTTKAVEAEEEDKPIYESEKSILDE